MLCQAYQQIQCAGNSCSVGAHVCAMVDRDSSHGRGTKHPACKHRWGKKAAESDALQTYDYVQAPLGGTTNYHARMKRFAASLPRDRALAILRETDEARRKMWSERVQGPKAAAPPRPPRATDGSGTGATQRTVLLDTSGGSEEQGGSETDDECLPPCCADTLAERNRAEAYASQMHDYVQIPWILQRAIPPERSDSLPASRKTARLPSWWKLTRQGG